MNNACPECGAVYAVAEKDIGRRIACKKCSTALIVADDGLRRESEAGAITPPRRDDTRDRDDRERDRDRDDDRGRRRDEVDERGGKRRERDDDEVDRDRGKKRGGADAAQFFNKLKGVADVPTWIYGVGLFLTIYGFFGFYIDKAREVGRQGSLDSEKTEFEAYRRSVEDPPSGNPNEADKKRLDERRKEWEKKTEPSLRDDLAFAKSGTKRGQLWSVVFKMLGFFLLAFGSIGFLRSDNPPLKRILGGVTILLILLQVIGGGAGLHLDMGGGGSPVPNFPPDRP